MSEPNWIPLGTGSPVDYKGAWGAGVAYVGGDVVERNGVQYLAVNPSTGQTPEAAGMGGIGLTLPASPYDGMEYTLVDSLTAPSYAWRFRYTASITDAYKWVFIGGSPAVARVDAAEACTSATFVDLATVGPQIVLPRIGHYFADLRSRATASAAGQFAVMNLNWTGGDLTGPNIVAVGQYLDSSRRVRFLATDFVPVRIMYRIAGTSVTFDQRDLAVWPVRV